MLAGDRKTIVLLIVSGVLIVGGLSLAGAAWSESSLTEWIEAVATCAAFIAAVVAARYAAAVFAIEDERDERRLKAEERAQAEQVAAWIDNRSERFTSDRLEAKCVLYVRNASTLPVYECEFEVIGILTGGSGRKELANDWLDRVAPTTIAPLGEPHVFHNVTLQFDLTGFERRGMDRETMIDVDVAMTFRDTGNRWWHRRADGVLEGPFDVKP